MNNFLHPRKEIYDAACLWLLRLKHPDNMDQTERVSVNYEMDDKTVYYTVIFSPLFDADTRTFIRWGYLDTEMYVKPH